MKTRTTRKIKTGNKPTGALIRISAVMPLWC
jgi:hypothetical protein